MTASDVTARGKAQELGPIVCPACAKVLEGEPNFCSACGGDIRGLSGDSDTFSGAKLIDGRYKLLEKLGEGGMGSVYKVEHVRMGKIAALKVMRPDAAVDKGLKARFLQEARVVARLSHPNTVQVFDAGELDDGSLFMAMEYVPGKDLAWNLRTHGRLEEDAAIGVAVQLLASLAEAHESGVVHRDIKPANVMLLRKRSGGDQVKLLDFGIAKLAENEVRNSTTGDFVGTPAYMSPEQVRGEVVDARSDLYSLGALLFELVTGRQLYTGPTAVSIVKQHLEEPIPNVNEVVPDALVSPEFQRIVNTALAKAREERFADAEVMREALETLRRSRGHTTQDVTPMPAVLASRMLSREDFESFERKLRLRRVLAPIVALMVVVALAFGAFRVVEAAQKNDGPSDIELEPNDHVQRATLINLSKPVKGALGAAPLGESDRDLFVAQIPEAGRYRVGVSGIPDLNVTLEVLQVRGSKLARVVFLDDVGLGADEHLDGLMLEPGSVYLRIEEQPFCTEAPRPPREKSLAPYTITLEPLPAARGLSETEPNDTAQSADALPLTRAVTAWVGPAMEDAEKLSSLRPDAAFSAVDYWRVEAQPSEQVVVAIVPPETGSLVVIDEAELETWRNKKKVSSPTRPAPPAPAPLVVKGKPALLTLAANPTGIRRFRISPGRDAVAGQTYGLAAATSGPNGVSGLLDLVRSLDERPDAQRTLVEDAVATLKQSPDLARLTEAKRPQ